jgi:hypothetical protein
MKILGDKLKSSNKYLYIIVFLITFSCSKENEEIAEVQFICTVDYVEFTSDVSANVKFDVIVDGISDSFIAKHSYTSQGTNSYIGDNIVNIYNFNENGNEANFDFEYGLNLGAFCAELFPNIPFHEHNPFAAEATKDLDGKNLGKWKIKKKTPLKSIDKQ